MASPATSISPQPPQNAYDSTKTSKSNSPNSPPSYPIKTRPPRSATLVRTASVGCLSLPLTLRVVAQIASPSLSSVPEAVSAPPASAESASRRPATETSPFRLPW